MDGRCPDSARRHRDGGGDDLADQRGPPFVVDAVRHATWSWRLAWDATAKEVKQLDSPCDCTECDSQQEFGCGEWAGKGTAEWEFPRHLSDPWVKGTCPRHCLMLPEVLQVFSDRDDFERGILGNVNEIEAPYLQYLRAALAERAAWKAEMERQSKP